MGRVVRIPKKKVPIPVLPYDGGTSSGWSGSTTSHARAAYMDDSGITGKNQKAVIDVLARRKRRGVTWREMSSYMGDAHHGTVSGTLSVLHKNGHIERLAAERDNCKIYVLLDYVDGRETETHGHKSHTCPECGHRF